MKNPLSLLERADVYEISGNRMTSYGAGLGGGSIHYWDGRRGSFDTHAPLCELTAFVEVLDAENHLPLLQPMYHVWRPDRISNRFHSHKRSYIFEDKTIHDDTFVSIMDIHSEYDVDLILRVNGLAVRGSRVQFKDNKLMIEERRGADSRVFKALAFNVETRATLRGRNYVLEIPLCIKSAGGMENNAGKTSTHAFVQRVVLAVGAGDDETTAIRKCDWALKSPKTLFKARKREWERYFSENVPEFTCDNPAVSKMYYFIQYVIKSNIYRFGKGYFRKPFASTGKFRLMPQWFWDSAFGAINEKWLNAFPLPQGSLETMLGAARGDGRMPFALCLDQYTYGDEELIQPFILPLAIWDVYLKHGDRRMLRRALKPLIGFDDWMRRQRDPKGEDLIQLTIPGESGWDNSKRYVQNKRLVQEASPMIRQKRHIQSPDFNTYVYMGRRIIARMAKELGLGEIEVDFIDRARRTARGLATMWDAGEGLYLDRFMDDHAPIRVRTPGGMIPLLSGLVGKNEVAAIVEVLTDPRRFWTRYPVPTLDRLDEDHTTADEYFSYWNGRVWPNINWLLIEGLCRARQYSTARELLSRTISMCFASGEAWCMENYHPETGCPFFTHNIFNYTWGCLFNDLLLRRVAGIQANAPRDQIIINPLMMDGVNHLAVKNLSVGGHRVGVELTRKDGAIALRFIHEGPAPIVLTTSSGSRKVHNRTVSGRIKPFEPPHWLEL